MNTITIYFVLISDNTAIVKIKDNITTNYQINSNKIKTICY